MPSSADWSLAPSVVIDLPHIPSVWVSATKTPDGTFSIVVQGFHFNPNFVVAVSGGGSISNANPPSGVPILYTPPATPTGPAVLTITSA